MHRRTLWIAALPVALLALSCGGPGGPALDADTFAEARRLAAEHDLPILIDFWRDG
jgi:hypothetical protein